MRLLKVHLLWGVALALAGCAGAQDNSDGVMDESEGQAEAALSAGTQGTQGSQTGIAIYTAANTSRQDVVLLEYGVVRVACTAGEQFAPLRFTTRVELTSMLLPGGIPAFENSPLDRSSAHPFGDLFQVLPPGCYDISATPLQADGSLSGFCHAAFQNHVEVTNGQTSEIFLINQCEGAPAGALDGVVALNTPPYLQNLTYSPSKFVRMCSKARVCATAADPDGDPIEFEWVSEKDSSLGISVVSHEQKDNATTECVDLMPVGAGNYSLTVRAYDLLHVQDQGQGQGQAQGQGQIRFETWLRDHGYPNTSHASLQFPLYVGR